MAWERATALQLQKKMWERSPAKGCMAASLTQIADAPPYTLRRTAISRFRLNGDASKALLKRSKCFAKAKQKNKRGTGVPGATALQLQKEMWERSPAKGCMAASL